MSVFDGPRRYGEEGRTKAPRCRMCKRLLDGEAEVNKAVHCTNCQSILRSDDQTNMRERQRKIEEELA